MRIGVSGSRHLTYSQKLQAENVLRAILSAYGKGDELHHGTAVGVDTIAGRIAKCYGIKVVGHPPKVHQWAAPGGYKDRNIQLVKSVDMLIAVHSPNSTTGGTLWTYTYANSCGVRTEWIELSQ